MYILPFFLSMSSPIPLAGHVLARNPVEVNLSLGKQFGPVTDRLRPTMEK